MTQCSVSRFFLACPEKQLKSKELCWVLTIELTASPASPAPLRFHNMGKTRGKLEESFNKKNNFFTDLTAHEEQRCISATEESKFSTAARRTSVHLADRCSFRHRVVMTKHLGVIKFRQLRRKANST